HLHTRGLYTNINAGGDDSLEEIEMRSVALGQIFRQKQRALVWTNSGKDLRNFDGLLGPRSLGIKTVSFDFDRQLVSFETR
ncbi:MAG TPA: hypothetical protein VGV15_07040, partial [Terriglobales bacterium]|nr:hypothetical protein [Terriglobales bacterium]